MKESVFSKNMLRARKIKGWSQEGAAAAMRESGATDITRRVIGYYEEGKSEPSHETLEKICMVYGIRDLKAFLIDPGYFQYKRTSPEELHKRFTSLDETTRRAVELLLGLG
jgi:transcriptional regulator with XRE-family HTH domain